MTTPNASSKVFQLLLNRPTYESMRCLLKASDNLFLERAWQTDRQPRQTDRQPKKNYRKQKTRRNPGTENKAVGPAIGPRCILANCNVVSDLGLTTPLWNCTGSGGLDTGTTASRPPFNRSEVCFLCRTLFTCSPTLSIVCHAMQIVLQPPPHAPKKKRKTEKKTKLETNATPQSADGCACPRGNRRPAGATSVECLHFRIAHWVSQSLRLGTLREKTSH